jgi:hypothetical protein
VVAAVAAALLLPAFAAAGPVKAGAAEVDASWHVGASAGQYATSTQDGGDNFVHPSEGNYDPHALAYRRKSSYGMQSRLKVRAIVVEGPNGKRFALLKNDLYIPQDLVWRRAAQLLEERGESGIGRQNLTMAVSHNHSSPFYSSTSWGVWTFQDVFDIRFFNYYAEKMAEAVEKAATRLVPVKVGASVSQFDKTHRHSYGPAIADDGTPAGFPQSDTDHDLVVIRFDDLRGRNVANVVNWALHPEFLDGNDLISADYLGPLEAMTDRATGGLTIWTQGAVGTAEPENSRYHDIHERLEFSHREYGQAEYGARLMSNAIVDTWRDIARGTPEDPERFVPFDSDFRANEVAFKDRWFPGPVTRPYPSVSSCRTNSIPEGDPRLPVVGLPNCIPLSEGLDELAGFAGLPEPPAFPKPPIDPGLTTSDFTRAGVPVPGNYSAPSYTGLQEDIDVHLQAFRIGDILVTVCSCEQWSDQSHNIKTRTDRRVSNEHLGYDWKQRCEPIPGSGSFGSGPEGYGDGKWSCVDPRDESKRLPPLADENVERMHREVTNPANGWNDVSYASQAEAEQADLEKIKGNYTHDDRCARGPLPAGEIGKPESDLWDKPCGAGESSPSAQLGYRLTVAMGMGNDYNGYIATYREYQRGDHYRKALTGWGPHSSDYMATRLVNMGRVLKGGDETKLLPAELLDFKVPADLAVNDARARALGTNGSAAISAYEARLPDDGGQARAVTQPPDIERFDGTFFTWNGGSNYTDDPKVRVQRRVGGVWRDYAGQSGQLPITIDYPQGEEAASHETGGFEWKWTAHFEAFAARFVTTEGERATPAGEYRFVVDGERREGRRTVPYHVESRSFQVKRWDGITVEDVKVDPDGRVSFAVGPTSRNKKHRNMDGGGDVIVPSVGPIDYPDSYDYGPGGPLPEFITNRPEIRLDPSARSDPSKGETYCFDCTFRPWVDAGDAVTATVTFVRRDGSTFAVPAARAGGRWRSARALAAGEAAVVGADCVRDGFGNFNGAPSARVGATGAPAGDAACRASGSPGAGGSPGGGGAGGGGGGAVGGGLDLGARLAGCVRPSGRLGGLGVGPLRLGRSRSANRRALPANRRVRRSVDHFCLSDGRHMRAGYPSRRLTRAERRRAHGRAILVLTSSRHYAARGVRNGSSRRTLGRRFGRLRSHRVGRNRWYLARGRRARILFKVRGGRVQEIGLGDRRLTRGRRATVRYLRSFN